MNKVLIQTLNGSVTDDSLPKYGVLSIRVNSSANEDAVIGQIAISKATTLKSKETQFVTPYNQSSVLGTTYDIPANSYNYFETLLSTAGIVEVPNLFNLKKLAVGNALRVNCSDLVNCNELTLLSGQGVGGDLSLLGELPLLGTLSFDYSGMSCDAMIFADVNTFVSLQNLTLTNCPNITNRNATTKTAIEAAHPGITVTW